VDLFEIDQERVQCQYFLMTVITSGFHTSSKFLDQLSDNQVFKKDIVLCSYQSYNLTISVVTL
jgi:hypothetical protein